MVQIGFLFIVFVWSLKMKVPILVNGWRQNQEAKLKIVGGALHFVYVLVYLGEN